MLLLSHDVTGSGDPLVLLHAGVADRRMWDRLVPALEHEFLIIRPDLRGSGETPLPPGGFSGADDVVVLLDLGVASAAVVGASFGGQVALELALLHPERVSALVLLSPARAGLPPSADLRAFGAEEARLLEAGDVEAAVGLNVTMWLGPEADADTRDALADMQRRAFEVQLAADGQDPPPEPRRVDAEPSAVGVATVVVRGAAGLDPLAPVSDLLVSQIPGARLVELPWAGHLPALVRPDEVAALLLGLDLLRG